jgi:hypothetical protein
MAVPTRTRLIALVTAMIAVLALVGVGVVRAGDEPSLPPIEADRLLANTVTALARPITIAGDVESHLDLGLPEVPAGLSGEGGLVAMIGGTQRFRVWHSPQGLRLAHITQVSERDLVVNQQEAWWWDAAQVRATKVSFDELRSMLPRVPVMGSAGPAMGPTGTMAMDPIVAARRGIEALSPYASVSVNGTDHVAGRAVYGLVLTPLTDRTLIGSIEVSIDAETWLPLRFQVIARASGEAAMSAGFTSVSYAPIDPSVFAFTPPPGAEVIDGLDSVSPPHPPQGSGGMRDGSDVPRVFGDGFEVRVAIPMSRRLVTKTSNLLPYAGPLFSAVDVRAGGRDWLVIGAVPPDVLQADAASLS